MAQYTFISYAHEDSRFAISLARDLQRQGVAVWLDQWDIPPEAEWDKAIERAVKTCRRFLVVLSPAAVNSWLVRDQFVLATQTGKTIVPVLYQPCRLPSVLQDVPYIDFSGHSYRAALGQLLGRYFPGQVAQLEYRPKAAWDALTWSWRRSVLPLFIDLGGRNGKAAPSQLPAHPLPNQALELKYETGSLAPGDLTPVWFQKLLNLLWPGWLGPLILLLLLVAGTYSFWPGDETEPSFPASAIATLEIVRPTPTPQPLPTPVKTRVRITDGQVMVYIPAGEFLMGSAETDPLADDDEKPLHRVFLDAFWIDKTEITNIQYQWCVEAGACTPHRNQGKRFSDNHQPVVGVDWSQAAAYCQWGGGRLPTEAEWEKAARGTEGRIYPWGDEFDGSRLNFCDANCIADWKDRSVNDGYRFTAPVGNYLAGASPYGVLDMSGNVWEWTMDWYDAGYYNRAAYENPDGPPSGQQRVVRGGSWSYYGKNLRVANRHRDSPTYRYDNIGFRCLSEE